MMNVSYLRIDPPLGCEALDTMVPEQGWTGVEILKNCFL
jgi:hypothetical protein